MVYRTVRAYGVAEADVALIERMQEASRYSVRSSFGESAACHLQTGEKQARPLRPSGFLGAIDALLPAARATGLGRPLPANRPMHGASHAGRLGAAQTQQADPHPATASVHDSRILAINRPRAVIEALLLGRLVESWEEIGRAHV